MGKGARAAVRLLSAAALALALAAPGLALAAVTGTYEHIWQAQSMFGGDLGGKVLQAVEEGVVTLEEDGDNWTGAVTYRDRIGIEDNAGRVTVQIAEIALTLEGTWLDGDVSLGGTFRGTIRLWQHGASDPARALDGSDLGEPESDVTYDVTGHWGATIVGDMMHAEVLFETAAVQGEPMQDTREAAARFNRLSTLNPDALGEAQTFTIELGGSDGYSPIGGSSDATTSSFFEYVRKGLAGSGDGGGMHVPLKLATVARDLVDAAPEGATPLPEGAVAVDLDLSGAYLDAKNRAAGLLDDDGPTTAIQDHGPAWQAGREATVRPVAPADVDRLSFYAERLLGSLEGQEGVPGADELLDDVDILLSSPGGGTDPAPLVKLWSEVAEATGPVSASADVLAVSETVEVVLSEPLPASGPLADAVLVAADDETAPVAARSLEFWETEPSLDVTASPEGDALPNRVLGRAGTADDPSALTWTTAAGPAHVAPATWAARISPAGRLAWLAGEDGSVALTDGALRGWAFRIERGYLVESERAGRIAAVFALE